nr:MAG TPA: hypothetical protein [Caudoviricetes sp.]
MQPLVLDLMFYSFLLFVLLFVTLFINHVAKI